MDSPCIMPSTHLLHSKSLTSLKLPEIPLHLLCTHCLHTVQTIEFTPTPFRHTPHCHFPEFSICPDLILQCITFVLLMFTLSPFNSNLSFQHLSFSINSSSVSAIRHKSSASSNFQGNPALNSLESASK